MTVPPLRAAIRHQARGARTRPAASLGGVNLSDPSAPGPRVNSGVARAARRRRPWRSPWTVGAAVLQRQVLEGQVASRFDWEDLELLDVDPDAVEGAGRARVAARGHGWRWTCGSARWCSAILPLCGDANRSAPLVLLSSIVSFASPVGDLPPRGYRIRDPSSTRLEAFAEGGLSAGSGRSAFTAKFDGILSKTPC